MFRRQSRLALEDVQDTLEDDADSVSSRIRYGRLCELLARDVGCPTGLGLDPSGLGRSIDGSLDSACEVGRGGGEGRDEGLEGVDEGARGLSCCCEKARSQSLTVEAAEA